MTSLPPFLIFYVGAVVSLIAPARLRPYVLLLVPLVGGWNVMQLDPGTTLDVPFLSYTLSLLHVDRLSLLFGYLFHLAAFFALIFSLQVRDPVQQVSSTVYVGSALGAVFAGDLISLFVFWELLAVSSVFLILARRTERARRASMRYLIVQVSSGVLLLAGTLVHVADTGSIAFSLIGLHGLAGWLIFLAFGIKACFPLLHNWAVDAYPEATPTGTVFLGAFTTKVAIYALVRAYPGTEILIYIGTVMAVFPIFYAVIENDLRRVLIYSMINQLGFMVVGVGLGTELALNGTVSHAFNDVIFKSLLLMSMGAVLQVTGRINGSDLGGLYKTMPITAGLCIVGAMSISAFPLFSGFVSKSMIMTAALEQGYPVVWLGLLFASAGVFHHAGIKIPFFAFFAHDSGIRAHEPPFAMLLAMALAAFVCVFNGVYPAVLYSLLPFPVDYVPYTASHVLEQTQLLVFSALAFTMLKLTGIYPPELHSTNIDSDWTYRRLLPWLIRRLGRTGAALDGRARRLAGRRAERFVLQLYRHHGPQGILARTWPTGSMVLWVAILLSAYLLLYFADFTS